MLTAFSAATASAAVGDSAFRVGPVEGALNLSWDDCGLAGANTKLFDCRRNSGDPFTLIGSFVPPPGVNRLSGAIADLGVYAGTLPDWWKHGISECRRDAGLIVSYNFTGGPNTCSKAWVTGLGSRGFTYTVGYYGPNTARLQLISAVPRDAEAALDPNTEYYAFKVYITRDRTYSTGQCEGCEIPARITLHQIQLTQPAAAGYDPLITSPLSSNHVYWQTEPGPIPRIASFAPAGGAPGQIVTLSGAGFTGASSLKFKTLDAESFAVVSDSVITATVPASARTGTIAVTAPRGTTQSDSLFIVRPTIRSFTPRTAPTGHTITIDGTNFTRATAVTFSGIASSFTVASDSLIHALVPAGTADGPISVRNAGGTAVSDSLFRAGPMAPAIVSFAPGAGAPGVIVTIRGSRFTGTSLVTFNPAPASFTTVSDSIIHAIVPATARTGTIAVANSSGSGTSIGSFIVAPRITGFSPRAATVRQVITVSGENFLHASTVEFNGLAAAFTILSDTDLLTTVPEEAVDGPITIASPGGSDTSDSTFHVIPLEIIDGGINLSWDDCGAAGTAHQTFDCESNVGTPFALIASFVPPVGVDTLLGMSAQLHVTATTLPDWWKHGVGQCRGASAVDADFEFAAAGCADYWPGSVVGGSLYSIGVAGPNSARITVQCAIPPDEAGPVSPATEYSAFRLRLLRTNTIGAGSCAGCFAPANLELKHIQLFQPASSRYDPIVTSPITRSNVSWQDLNALQPSITSISPTAGAPGSTVTISGAGLISASTVRFGTTNAVFNVISGARIDAIVPPGARTGSIHVMGIYGSDSSDDVFIVAPDLSSFAPHSAPVGSLLTIRGYNLAHTTAVRFNGAGAAFTVSSDSVLLATVPIGAVDGPIAVTNPGGSDTSDDLFSVGPTPPAGLNLSWNHCGAAGAELETFACSANSPTRATVVASFQPPLGVSELIGLVGDLRVTSGSALPDWWKHGGVCRQSGDLFASFDYAPVTGCVDFWRGRATGGNYNYEIGYGGVNSARLMVAGSLSHVNRSALDAGVEYFAFKVSIARTMVAGVGGCSGCATPVRLTLQEIRLFQPPALAFDPIITTPLDRNTILWQGEPGPGPEIVSFAPQAGPPGTVVTIRGLNFTGTSLVSFNSQPAAFTASSDSVIHTTVPAGAHTGPIDVTTHKGTMRAGGTFIVAPRITSFSPPQAPDGHTITITGANFMNTSSVQFNGMLAVFTVHSQTSITAAVPVAATSGPLTVTNPGGSANSEAFLVGPLILPGGGINLSWTDCGVAGTETMTFACNTNTGSSHVMIASFTPPPNVPEFLGISARIDIRSGTATLPDWWRHGTPHCRGTTGLGVSFDFTTGPSACTDFFAGQAAGGYAYDVGFGSPDRARFSIQAAIPFGNQGPVAAGTEYYAFKANVLRAKSTGAGSCSGCSEPMCIVLNEIQLFQPLERNFDPQITTPINRNFISWQSAVSNCVLSTPVEASVVTCEARSDRVRVVWMTGDVDEAAVYRREGNHAWIQMARLVPDGSRRLTFDDYDVLPGARYAYRLGITLAAGEVYVGETSVSVPSYTALAMSGVRWDAGSRGVLVSLALPRAGAAMFEIYDLGGRRYVHEALEGLSAGTHDVRIGGAGSLRPGMYFARLSQGGDMATGRFVVVQ